MTKNNMQCALEETKYFISPTCLGQNEQTSGKHIKL